MADEVEMLNTTAETLEDTDFNYENLFTDNDTEESTEAETTADGNTSAEADTVAEESQQNTAENTSQPEFVDLKYLGHTTQLPKNAVETIANALGSNANDIVSFIQKGMNYDKAIINTPLHKIIDKYADGNNMTREEYIKFLENGADGFAEKVARDRITSQHPDWDDEKVEMQIRLDAKDKAEQKIAKEKETDDKAKAPFKEFVAKYPDVNEFPNEVVEEIRKGVSPIAAYESYLQTKEYNAKMAELNTLLEQAKKDVSNNAKAVGSMRDGGSDAEEADPFLIGLAL